MTDAASIKGARIHGAMHFAGPVARGACRLAWGVFVLTMCMACRAFAADEPAEKPLEFRRWFVPADRPQEWPKGNTAYLPIDREEFERLLEAANAAPRGSAGTAPLPLAGAHYEASLDGDLLVGQARFEIANLADKSRLLTLDPWGLSLTAARWEDERDTVVGQHPGGALAVVVERSGNLLVNWSLRGKRDPNAALTFPLELPPAAVCQFNLQLPPALAPTLADGVETGDRPRHQAGRWNFQLGGRTRALLKIGSTDAPARSRRLTLLQEKTTYILAPGGIDVVAQLKLDVHREPLQHLELDLDSPLSVVSVQHAAADVPWSIADAGAGKSKLSLQFVEPLLGPGRIITVTALAPMDVGQPSALPRLRVRDVSWQEGEMTLVTPGPLALDTLLPRGCRQTKLAPLSAGPPGESIALQLFSPDASVVVQVARRRSRVSLTSGVALRFAADSVRAEFRGLAEALDGERFVLHADLAAGWDIEEVATDPPGALANWDIDRTVRPEALVLQLAEPITPTRPLPLYITAHREGGDTRLTSTMLSVLRFRDVVSVRQLLALESLSGQVFTLDGPDRPRIRSRALLAESERALLPSAFSESIFDIDSDRPDWNVAIERQTPRYAADIHAQVVVDRRQLTESYRIRCQPDGSRIDRLVVSFSQARDEAWAFNADAAVGPLLSERLDAAESAAVGVPQAGEAWLLRLARPTADPFEVTARRSWRAEESFSPSLATLPEATNQQGFVEVRFLGGGLPMETAPRLEPVPPPLPAVDESSVVAAFRYDPLKELGDKPAAGIVFSRPSSAARPAHANVWRLRLDSHYLSTGDSFHAAQLSIENHGAADVALRLPPNCEWVRCKVDGLEIAHRSTESEIRVPLPEAEMFPLVYAEFLRHERPLGIVARREAPWPEVDLPIVARQWTVSSVSQYEPLSWSAASLPGTRRFLGFLGRAAGERQFNPIRPTEWRRAAEAKRPDADIIERANLLLDTYGKILAADSSISDLGQLLTAGRDAEPDLFGALRVDVRSLSSVAIGPATLLARGSDTNAGAYPAGPRGKAIRSFERIGLALLIDGQEMILTSRSAAIETGQEIDDGASVFYRRASNFETHPAADMSIRASLNEWLQSPRVAWQAEPTAEGGEFACFGPALTVDPTNLSVSRICLVRTDVVTVAGWALAAIALALGVSVRRRRWLGLLSWITCAGAAATWIPLALMPLAWGAVIGGLAAIAWSLIMPSHSAAGARSAPAVLVGPRRAEGLVAGAAVLACCCLAASSAGEEPETQPDTGDSSSVYRVFVPLNDDQEQGAHYHVPRKLYDELRRRAGLANHDPRGCLVTRAHYRCGLARERLGGPIKAARLAVRLGLEVLSADTQLHLSFQRRQAELVSDSATLDGQPIDLVWSKDGNGFSCRIAEPGSYELAFEMTPTILDEAEARGVTLAIPKVASAVLDVDLPEEGAPVEVPLAKGEILALEGGRLLRARLGPTDMMTLRWPKQAAVASVVEADELLWLNVRPGSVVLEVNVNLNVSGGALRQVEFMADRKLRLVPGAFSAKEELGANDISDAPQTIKVDLERPLTGQASLRLSFLMTGASGVGTIRLPSFHIKTNARVVRRWLAVTVDPGLEYEARDGEQLETLAASDFAAKWPEADPILRDALIYRLTEAETSWNLATRSREPQTTVKESLSLGLERGWAKVRYEAQLMTSAGYVFQHRLAIPAGIEIERVTVKEEGIDRVARWARGEPGIVTVFLNRRITGSHQLAVSGRLLVPPAGRVDLPRITLESSPASLTTEQAEVLQRTVYLYRQPTVNVSVEDLNGLSPLQDPAPDPLNGYLGRLLTSYAADKSASAVVQVSPNEPTIRDAELTTIFRYVNRAWVAETDYRFRAEQGVVDLLRFDLPTAWTANVEIVSPAAAFDLSEQPGQNRKLLTLHPLTPLAGQCAVKLRAVRKFSPGEPVSVPECIPLGLPAGEHYWVLPRRVGVEQVTWDVSRLTPAALPPGADQAAPESSLVYRAVGERPQAVMSAVKASALPARARLADIHVAVNEDHAAAAMAIDLNPGGRHVCPLELNAGWQLLEMTVGGQVVAPVARGVGKWDVPLISNRLPQRIEALAVLDTQPLPSHMPVPIAALGDWPIEETLFSIHAPDSYRVRIDASPISAEFCESVRLKSAQELTDLPAELINTAATSDLAAWCRPWARWFRFCSQKTESLAAKNEENHSDKSPSVFDNWARSVRRFHVAPVIEQVAREPLVATQPLEVWRELHGADAAAHFHWTGLRGSAELRLTHEWRHGEWRILEAVWICTGFIVAVLLCRHAALRELPKRWPHALGIALGLLWWLFAQPSALGWLFIAASLIAALRSALRPPC